VLWVRLPIFLCAFSGIFSGPSPAHARKIDLSKEKFATYLRGSFSTSNVGKSAYADSSGVGTSFTEEPKFGYGGGIGLLYRIGRVNITAGVDVLTPARIEKIEGKNASDQVLMTLKSTVIGVVPNAGLEFTFYSGPRSRLFVSGNFGYASVTILNDYQMTSLGQTTYSVTNYTEEGNDYALSGYAGGGFEFILADNTSVLIEGGYRSLQVTKFTHVRDGNSLRGTMTKGEPLTNIDNTHRALNLSGYLLGGALRFYF